MSALTSLANAIHGYHHLLLAFSGGLDSTVLLHRLVMLREQQPELQLRAVHIHHGLSRHADQWAGHCQLICQQWQVDCEVIRVKLDAASEQGIEGAARLARYHALRQLQQPDELLLTAQHLNDQCETFLLALKRGSGPAGLAAMPAFRCQQQHAHARPLLQETRSELARWAQDYQLSWIEDESNQDCRYDRNFLRRQIIPQLEVRWPHFSAMAARSAALCAEQEALLDELLAPQLAVCIQPDGSFDTGPLHAMSPLQRYALLRRWIAAQQGEMPSREGLQRLWQEVVISREDAMPVLRWGNQLVRRYRQRLWLLSAAELARPQRVEWLPPYATLALPAGLGRLQLVSQDGWQCRAPRPDERVSVRFQAQGAFYVVGRSGSRSLKKLWQEYGIPPWLRTRTPLIFFNETLIAALGVFITRDGQAGDENKPCWYIRWLDNHAGTTE
ncbi:tRNA lysidine(34) synthetase TilS [Erwinia sp. OLTSP20]|uniref:tRNA lysidine(34) synthetase TilS n=1 Tax=unclassified Erwinia TaxID=2622719 RepID=UPI000C19A0ED|nr:MULTISPECIES: tRNA lysidine(34) synthetase TilS [unclassified Erwinia]PIJ49849.1 tRNA lysidine(34) synthetase TilS [Erwinia sp. OAMSP11]PIJ70948.1 tRNA lysidine(34) synthetase TilS [Erwinia sp. OLSSP12]PIJ80314.1 tRNA lysidine(34) synthetase TilS [Erwinia sp. OLCASP19]PIJ82438.1 tRNA lysidine(34) synthetase TilS [Erwinia sp. OLMTSP26]PIJ85123.1 tRNA lysidine(34) synthetase TilS [Erwinia sp. OLMDSP33]